MSHATVLIVDDEPRLRRVLEMLLTDQGHRVVNAGTLAEGRRAIAQEQVDVALVDLMLPDGSGLDLLKEIQERMPDLPTVVMTAFGTIETAVQAMQLGARTYLVKPFDSAQVETVIARALEWRQSHRRGRFLRDQATSGLAGFIGEAPVMRAVFDLIARVAPTAAPVLLQGETGTGKELAARAVHAASGRADALFVAINCAAIPAPLLEAELFGVMRGAYTGAHADREGKFELADGGTLFLDEIGDLPLEMQAKLLRVIEQGVVERIGGGRPRRVDARIIAATHRDLAAMSKEGAFRADLYYRLAVVPITLPPLRQRRDDIPLLAVHAVERFAKRIGRPVRLADDAFDALRDYDWPGNVRELHNVLERAVLLSDDGVIAGAQLAELLAPPLATPRYLPAVREVPPLADVVSAAERVAIREALAATGDNKTRAAERLGISVRTLWYKLRRLGLVEGDHPPDQG
jgi:two-component system response regulator AtoC